MHKDAATARDQAPNTSSSAPLRHNTAKLLLAGSILAGNRLLLAAGLRRRRDGWRRATGLVLRCEASTFVLSAFGLDVWSGPDRPGSPTIEQTQARIAQRLSHSLAQEPDCCVYIARTETEDRRERCAAPSYTLTIAPWIDGPGRFVPPVDWSGVEPAHGTEHTSPLMNIVTRVAPGGGCDLWLRINHVGADGVPMQEVLTRLEKQWGTVETVLFPTPESFEPFTHPRPSPGRSGLAEVQFFADFAPLLAWRKRQNASLPEPMTVSAALLWHIGQTPELKKFRLGTTVEVAPSGGMPRGVGVVVVRPLDYHSYPPPDRVPRFIREFNHQLERNRRRASIGCVTLDAAALMPPRLATPLIRYALTKASRAFGSIGVTMLRDARVFGAPIAEVGHDHGFIAVGSVSLPCADGRAGGVGCVTVKGPRGVIDAYPALIKQAIASCATNDTTDI